MNTWTIDSFIFLHPFNCIISGPTMSGKTYLLHQIINNIILLVNPTPNKIYYCYKTWQDNFDKLKNINPHIDFIEGLINFDEVNGSYSNIIRE